MRSFLALLLVAAPALAQPTETIDREAISEGVGKIKPKIMACGDSSPATGTVKVVVQVAPSGSVTSATIKATPDQALGDCVAAVMKTATFRATLKGGTFSYPFVFGDKSKQPPAGDPDSLDRVAITEGIAKVKPQILACASKTKGTVKVKVEVAPAGDVSAVTVVETTEVTLGDCIAAALKKATFKKTSKGGTFSYPFIF